MVTNGAFTALILIICGHLSGAVLPPSNVNVKCENFQTTVSWNYSKHQPETIFWVNITGSTAAGSFEASTSDHHYNLSQFVFGSQEHYLSFLVVFVTAVQGGEQSEAVQSKSFSFNQLKAVDIKCSLDFPPVEVRKVEQETSVMFPNPLHFYNKLKTTVPKDSNAALRYSVSSSANTELTKSCSASDFNCKVTLPADKCVILKGELCFKECVDQIAFKETRKYCSEKDAVDSLVMFAIILGSIFLIVVVIAVIVICKLEVWTMNIPTPNIKENSQKNGKQCSVFIPSVKPEYSSVSIVSPPVKTTSLDSEDESVGGQPEPNNGGGDYDCRAEGNYLDRGCLDESNPNLEEMEGLASGANGTDADSPNGSVKTECVSLSSTEEESSESSPYDRQHAHFQRDLGDEEMVMGYGGN